MNHLCRWPDLKVTASPSLGDRAMRPRPWRPLQACAVPCTEKRPRRVSVWSTGTWRGSWKRRHGEVRRRNSSRVLERLSDAPSRRVSLSADPSAVLGWWRDANSLLTFRVKGKCVMLDEVLKKVDVKVTFKLTTWSFAWNLFAQKESQFTGRGRGTLWI